MKYLNVTTMTNRECSKFVTALELLDTMLCAYTQSFEVGTCDGDSGGPFVYNGKLIGISAWAIKVNRNCTAGKPDGYTRVSTFVKWIQDNMK